MEEEMLISNKSKKQQPREKTTRRENFAVLQSDCPTFLPSFTESQLPRPALGVQFVRILFGRPQFTLILTPSPNLDFHTKAGIKSNQSDAFLGTQQYYIAVIILVCVWDRILALH